MQWSEHQISGHLYQVEQINLSMRSFHSFIHTRPSFKIFSKAMNRTFFTITTQWSIKLKCTLVWALNTCPPVSSRTSITVINSMRSVVPHETQLRSIFNGHESFILRELCSDYDSLKYKRTLEWAPNSWSPISSRARNLLRGIYSFARDPVSKYFQWPWIAHFDDNYAVKYKWTLEWAPNSWPPVSSRTSYWGLL